jgi:hypothetical protein
MRTLYALIALGVLGGTPSASALTGQPSHLRSLRQIAMRPEPVARRPGHPNRHRYHDYGIATIIAIRARGWSDHMWSRKPGPHQ